MGEAGRSGEPDHYLAPSDIVGILDGQTAAAAVLALCCAERLSAIAKHMAQSPSVGATVRAGLDLGWSAAAGRGPGPGTIGRAISDLDHLLGSPDIKIGQLHFYLDDAICAASYALAAVRDGSLTAARNAVARCEDVYFQLASSIWPGGLEAQLESPIMREEVARQVRDARAIAAWGGAVPAPSLAALRQAADADGEVLVELIRGAPQPPEGPAPAGQLTLF